MLLSLLLTGVLGFTPINPPNALIQTPTDYDYKYTYHINRFQLTDGDDAIINVPYYNQSEVGYNNRYDLISPLHIGPNGLVLSSTYILNNPANVYWSYSPEGYFPTAVAIGNDLADNPSYNFRFTNYNNHNYLLKFDFSPSTNFIINVVNSFSVINGIDHYYSSIQGINSHTTFDFVIAPYQAFTISANVPNVSQFMAFAGFYVYDLGINLATLDGITDGYNDGYDAGYEDGYDDGHDDGFDEGYIIGEGDGYEEGISEGILTGDSVQYDNGYQDGVNDNSEAYNAGYKAGGEGTFLANLGDWMVPAIIIVLLGGGILSIMAIKKREG